MNISNLIPIFRCHLWRKAFSQHIKEIIFLMALFTIITSKAKIYAQEDRIKIIYPYYQDSASITCSGKVTTEDNSTLSGVKLNIFYKNKIIARTKTDEYGDYLFMLPPNVDLTIMASKKGFNETMVYLSSRGLYPEDEITKDLKLFPLRKEATLQPESKIYAQEEDRIRPILPYYDDSSSIACVGKVVTGTDSLLPKTKLKVFYNNKIINKVITDKNGEYVFMLPPNVNLAIMASKKGFNETMVYVSSMGLYPEEEIIKDITLIPLGEEIALQPETLAQKITMDTLKEPLKETKKETKIVYRGFVVCQNFPLNNASIKIFYQDSLLKEVFTNQKGEYSFEVAMGKKYSIDVEKHGFQKNSFDITPSQLITPEQITTEMVRNIDLIALSQQVIDDIAKSYVTSVKKDTTFIQPTVVTVDKMKIITDTTSVDIVCKGKITNNNQPLKGGFITIYLNNKPIYISQILDQGEYSINLKTNKNYLMKVTSSEIKETTIEYSTAGLYDYEVFNSNIELSMFRKFTITCNGLVHENKMPITYSTVKLFVNEKFERETKTNPAGQYNFTYETTENSIIKGQTIKIFATKENFRDTSIQFTLDTANVKYIKDIELKSVAPIIAKKEPQDTAVVKKQIAEKLPEISSKEKGDIVIHYYGNITEHGKLAQNVLVRLYKKGRVIDSLKTTQTGRYSFNLKPATTYSFEIFKYGYYPEKWTYTTSADIIDVPKDVELRRKPSLKLQGVVTYDAKPIDNVKIQVATRTEVIDEKKIETGGKFNFEILANETYRITATKEGFFQNQIELSTTELHANDTILMDIPFNKIQIDKAMEIKNIYYDYDRANLRKESFIELNKLEIFLKTNPNIAVEIVSHCDARGNDEYNMELAERRSNSVINYLKYKGIQAERMFSKAYGESRLIVKNAKTEAEHQLNRRSEFSVIAYDYTKIAELKKQPEKKK